MSKVKLGDITDSCLGKMLDAKKNKGTYHPYLANINVRWGEFDLNDLPLMRFEENEADRYGIQNGDLIMCEGGEPGRCAIWRNQIENLKIQKALHRIRAKEGVSIEYLYYWFLLAGQKAMLKGYFTETTIKHLPGDKLKTIELDLPDYDNQKKIAKVLSVIDEKIQNNKSINDNLLNQLKTIYDYWFVQFDFPDGNGNPYRSSGGKLVWNEKLKRDIPTEWICQNIRNLTSITWGQCPDGKNILSKSANKKDLIDYCSGAGDMKGGFLVDCQAKTDNSKRFAYENDILVSVAGKIGDMCVVDHSISLGRAAMAFSANNYYELTYIYLTLQALNKKMTTISTGSIQKVINNDHIDEFNFPYNEDIVAKFGKLTLNIFDELKQTSIENRELTKLRDWLLPMLMNGQATIDD